MTDNPKPLSPEAEFAAQVERLLAPVFAECFTEETRKVRNLLLVTSFVLILFVLGVVEVDAKSKVPLLGFNITVTAGLQWVLMALCGYFLSSLFARSYIEWNLWRLKHQSPMLALSNLQAEVSASLAAHYNRINSAFTLSLELYEKLRLLDKDPPSVVQIAAERERLYQQHQQLGDEFKVQWDAVGSTDGSRDGTAAMENGIMLQLSNMFERLTELDAQLDKERAARREQIAPDRAALERQLSEIHNEHQKQSVAPESKILQAKLYYLLDTVHPSRTTFRIRFFFEMAFPMLFGAVAIVSSFVSP